MVKLSLQFIVKYVIMATKYTLFFGIFFIYSFISIAQDGTLDLSFGNGGYTITDINGNADIINNVEQTFDEKLLVIGTTENPNSVKVISKYLLNGDLDLSFGNNGFVFPSYNASAYNNSKLIVKPDNSFFVLGSENEDFFIAKHLSNGVLDNTFGVNGHITTNVEEDNFQSAVLQDGGKIISIGRTKGVTNYYQIMMVRYLANGNLDTTFGNNGILVHDAGGEFFRARKIALQNDGKIILQLAEYSNSPNKLIVYRFMPNGNIDNSFGNNGKIVVMEDTMLKGGSLALKPNGKIITTASNPDSGITKIIQYLPNGTIDNSFADNGEKIINLNNFYTSKLFFQGNKILIYGHISEFEGTTLVLIRLTENGELDSTFGTNGFSYSSTFQSYDVTIQSDHKIVAVGSTYWYDGVTDFVLSRYNNHFLETPTYNLKEFSFYPNPSNGIYNITHDFITSETPYKIVDITGKLIQYGFLTGVQSELDLSLVEKGVYFFNASNKTIKLIKK